MEANQIDAVFAKLQKKYAKHPVILKEVSVAKELVDAHVAENPEALKGGTVQTVLDAIFAALKLQFPKLALLLSLVQALVDAQLGK